MTVYRTHLTAAAIVTASIVGAIANAALATPLFNVTPVGTIGGFYSGAGIGGINDSGQVSGSSFLPGNTGQRAFRWTPGAGIENLGSLSDHDSYGSAINNNGQVTGLSYAPNNGLYAFVASPGSAMTSIGSLGGLSNGRDINNSGQVSGESFLPNNTRRAFLYTPGFGMIDLGTLGGSISAAHGLNDVGQVTGSARTTTGDDHAFLYTPGSGMIDIGTLGGSQSTGYSVNDLGHTVGYSSNAAGVNHAFLYTEAGGMVDLGALTSNFSSTAYDINNTGDIVGNSYNAQGNQRAILWDDGSLLDLNNLIDPNDLFVETTSTFVLSDARGINENGWIVANGYSCVAQTCTSQAFLLTPIEPPVADVPGPGSLALLALGLLGAGLARRRRAA